MEELKYPYGRFEYGKKYSPEETALHISMITNFPAELRKITNSLTDAQLEQSYRPDGWTARQIIHHLADSHLNAFIRIKLSLTENSPVIKPYNQDSWAALPDSEMSPEVSLNILEGIHARWAVLLQNLREDDLKKVYIHPEYNREFPLTEVIALYAWHGKQHAGHLSIIQKNN
jgi:hypothetical protein